MKYEKLDKVNKTYDQKSIRNRLEAFFLDNLGKIITREQLVEVATCPTSGQEPENWHQRLSELRTDHGYTILSNRDVDFLSVGDYLMISAEKRPTAKSRKAIDKKIKKELIAISPCCSYPGCGLKDGDIDPVGGGTVRLQVDHKTAHDHDDMGEDGIENYQLLCGRHNVIKKNLWDDTTGKLNTTAILQALPEAEKKAALAWLNRYFKVK